MTSWIRAWWHARRRRLVRLWALGTLASIGVTAASALGFLEVTQQASLDLLLRLQGRRLPPEVAIVAIDDASFAALGERQPLPRDYLARIVRALQRSGAVVVGFDVTLTAATAEDAAFARALREFADGGVSRVVLTSSALPAEGPLAQEDVLDGVVRGSPDLPLDGDGRIRRVVPVLPDDRKRADATLALAMAARLGGADPAALRRALEIGAVAVPLWREGAWRMDAEPVPVRLGETWRVNFVGPAKSVLTVPSRVVVGLADAPIAADNPFRGRAVLVGGTFTDSRDFVETPHGTLAGVEVHANVLHMLLTRSFVRPSSWAVALALQLPIVFAAAVVMVTTRGWLTWLLILAGTPALGLLVSHLAFQRGSYWIDFMLPVVATRFLGRGWERLTRWRLREAVAHYVGRRFASWLIPNWTPERRDASVLVSDLRPIVLPPQTLAPEAVASRLAECLDVMSAAVAEQGGVMNEVVGDTVTAVFGARESDPDHARHAVRAALAIDRALCELNERWTGRGWPLVRPGVGIYTCEVLAGRYTFLGAAAAVAAAAAACVERLNKDFGTTIGVTESTRAAVGAPLRVRDCGSVALGGGAGSERVFEVVGLDGEGMRKRSGA